VAASLAHVPVGTHDVGITYDEYWRRTPPERARGIATPRAFVYEAQQAPLFYWVFAGVYRVLGAESLIGRVYTMRFLCVLLASVMVPIGFLIAQSVLRNEIAALGAALLMAWLPLLTVVVTHVTNDALAVPLTALAILFLVRRQALPLAVTLGLGLLSKAYFFAFVPVLMVLLFRKEWRRTAAIALGGAAILGGWWYLETWLRTGSLTNETVLRQLTLRALAADLFRANWRTAAMSGWTTFIWVGNWSFVLLRAWIYRVLALVCGIALIGVIRLIWRRAPGIALLAGVVAGFLAAVAYVALARFAVYGSAIASGWYFAPVLPAFAVLLIGGGREIAGRWRAITTPVYVTLFTAAGVFATNIYLLPYYAGLIFHRPNGALPAFHLGRLGGGGLWLMFQRLDLNKPAWIGPGLLMGLWVLYLAAACLSIAATVWLARAEFGARKPLID
jgi:Dolichyl-phosphate-mannose-protein mannosyltransferase